MKLQCYDRIQLSLWWLISIKMRALNCMERRLNPFHVLVVKNNCWMNTSLLLSVNLSPSLKCLILKDAHTRLLSVLMTGNGKYILLLLSNTLMRFCALDNGKISQVYIKRSRQICQIVRAIPEILTKLDVKYL